ncbi:MAG: DUF58 domain-containing protein [Actinomycetota bacterium]|nr:DUF58 domain-containing protein [Actinomycetota bacterium]
MSPTSRTALAALVIAGTALFLPAAFVYAAFVALAVAAIADALIARRALDMNRSVPRVVARGVSVPLIISLDGDAPDRAWVRQANAPDLDVQPATATAGLDARLVATRRGLLTLPPVAARRVGPLGLGAATFTGAEPAEVLSYPDVVAAQRIVIALRRGRFREPGRRTRGPLGLGTEFESIRDYLPDDDMRQINWRATARMGRPMTNQYRLEQDRDITCLLDAGRLMGAPLGLMTRVDAAVDAITAVALVADEVGDRCGVVVFDSEIRRRVTPRRGGGRTVVQAILDIEPTTVDSDYDLAFRSVGSSKRGLVIVCTDLVDDAAARSLLRAVPVLARRHAVVVASVLDPDLEAAVRRDPTTPRDVYASAVAHDVLDARVGVRTALQRSGATVIEAKPGQLGDACVATYLRLKARARL